MDHRKVFGLLNNDQQRIILCKNKALRLLDNKKMQDLKQELCTLNLKIEI